MKRLPGTLLGVAAMACLNPAGVLRAGGTNDGALAAPVRRLHLPDLDDTTIQGVRVAPGVSESADAGGPGPISLDAPGSSLSAGVPLPAARSSGKSGEFVAAPIPFLSPSIGFGIGLGAAYIYDPAFAGTNAPPWVTGGGGFYSDNGSWGGGVAHKMSWDDDRWRLLGALAYADLNYDFFGVGESLGAAGQSIPLRQTMTGGVLELLRGVGHRWYVGGRGVYGHVQSSIETGSVPVPPALAAYPFEVSGQLGAVGLRVQRDSRDSSFYPTRGGLLDFEANFFDPAVGSDFTFQTYAFAYNHFFPLAPRHVLAARVYGRTTSGDAPFFALSSFGTRADLRGYTPGRYRDKLMFAVQTEYRWRFTERFGLVAFGGVGGVAPDWGQFDQVLPGAGAGLRYVLAKKNNISLRFDAAWGRDETLFYFGVGEAF